MMLVIALLLLAAAGLGVAQMSPMTNCMATTLANPSCTVEYRPWMAPQIKPTSTVYDMIITTYLNVRHDHISQHTTDRPRSSTVNTARSNRLMTTRPQL
jgi:hypothetical protein